MVKQGSMRGNRVRASLTEAEEIAQLEEGILALSPDVGPSEQQAGAISSSVPSIVRPSITNAITLGLTGR